MHLRIKPTLTLLALLLVLWLGLKLLLPLCFPFLAGLALALLAEPLVGVLCRKAKLPRSLAAGVGVTAAFSVVAVLFLMLCALLVRELGLLAGVLPDLTRTARSGVLLLRDWLLSLADRAPNSLRPLLERNVEGFFSGGTSLLDKGFAYVLGLAGSLISHVPDSALNLGTAVISAFMISAKLPRIRIWLRRRFPGERLQPLLRTLKQLRDAAGLWLLAQMKLTAVTLGILLAGLLMLRIPYGALWAVGICLLDALPVLGTGTVLMPWALVEFLQGDRARAVGLLGIYGVITLTRSVLEPKLVGRQLGLDPLVTLFALYAGYKLWGLMGMLLAPLMAVTAIQVMRTGK